LYRYSAVMYEKFMKEVTRQREMIRRLSGGGQSVGLYKLYPVVTHSLKAPGLNP
jgi:hypothetical protein